MRNTSESARSSRTSHGPVTGGVTAGQGWWLTLVVGAVVPYHQHDHQTTIPSRFQAGLECSAAVKAEHAQIVQTMATVHHRIITFSQMECSCCRVSKESVTPPSSSSSSSSLYTRPSPKQPITSPPTLGTQRLPAPCCYSRGAFRAEILKQRREIFLRTRTRVTCVPVQVNIISVRFTSIKNSNLSKSGVLCESRSSGKADSETDSVDGQSDL
ncbi:hypothetical protein FHG87_023471 [Trinorchestia longiramus]|nr:hypothetical protein FHG87_023471 [Trinorchestia longiramus]